MIDPNDVAKARMQHAAFIADVCFALATGSPLPFKAQPFPSPSAADLDAVAEEQETAHATK